MGSFQVQSGNINYVFDFRANTGESPWTLSFGYGTGVPTAFDSPLVNQIITGITDSGHSVSATESYMLIGNTTGQFTTIYQNQALINPLGTNSFEAVNKITGSGPLAQSGMGYAIASIEGVAAVSSPFAPVDSTSGAGTVSVFKSFVTGGEGVTGGADWAGVGYVTGAVTSGFFGKSLAVQSAQYNDYLSIGAPAENNGSGAIHVYDINSLDFFQTISPTGDSIKNFGKSSAWINADSLEFLGVGYDQGGSGKLDVYKQASNQTNSFSYFQTIEPEAGAASGDMFGYSIDSVGSQFFIGGPKLGGSGAVYEYTYDNELASIAVSQNITGSDVGASDNFGKNISFNESNGIVTSDKNSGKGYVYSNINNSWLEGSQVSGSENVISGSFGGDLSGSHVTVFNEGNLTIGSSPEPYTYIYNTGLPITELDTRFSLSGSGGKLFDSDGNFVYGYDSASNNSISGNVFTGGFHNVFVNGGLCVSRSPRETGVINSATISETSGLYYYNLRVYEP